MLHTEKDENGKYCMSYPWHIISNASECVKCLKLLLPWFLSYCGKVVVLVPGTDSVQPQSPPLQLSPGSRAESLTAWEGLVL